MLQLGWLWTCPQILRPDWKGYPRTNTLAYWALSLVTEEKSFITLTPACERPSHFCNIFLQFSVFFNIIIHIFVAWYTNIWPMQHFHQGTKSVTFAAVFLLRSSPTPTWTRLYFFSADEVRRTKTATTSNLFWLLFRSHFVAQRHSAYRHSPQWHLV